MFLTDDESLLFSKYRWHQVSENQKTQLINEVTTTIDGNRLLNTSIDDLCTYLIEKYLVNIPVLNYDEIVADQREKKIDVRFNPRYFIEDKHNPVYVIGTEIEIIIPFSGDEEVFKVQPTTSSLNPPRGQVKQGMLHINISGTDLSKEQVQSQITNTLKQIEEYLTTLRSNASVLNQELPEIARRAIEARRQKLLANQNLVASLGFKIKERQDSSHTYTAPEVRRKIKPTLPPANSSPYKPEPVLPDGDYEHILHVIDNMAHVMERSPSAFASMGEEDLRTHFLVQLNGHYDGQATGETFNYEGKTDILIRLNGKNIFIGECKYWGGAQKFLETINQLLGYSSWRDTKVAVIIFSKNKDFTNVINVMNETVKQHPNFKRDLGRKSETSFRYVFGHQDDSNRELILTVMAFHVPSHTGKSD